MPVRIKRLLKELKAGLARIYGDRLKGLYLYGSYARGEAQAESDVDVMIMLDDYVSYGREIDRSGELVSELSLDYGVSISIVIMKESQWRERDTPFLRNIQAEGIPA
jgi:predicted nucleotidyltransferase